WSPPGATYEAQNVVAYVAENVASSRRSSISPPGSGDDVVHQGPRVPIQVSGRGRSSPPHRPFGRHLTVLRRSNLYTTKRSRSSIERAAIVPTKWLHFEQTMAMMTMTLHPRPTAADGRVGGGSGTPWSFCGHFPELQGSPMRLKRL
ncbi:hypothetical protein THAOC_07300, partial [Thalassiosira oceanica]